MSQTGTIFDLRRFCIHDGPGIRTTVFFKGCPLDCWWCHNPEGRSDKVEPFDFGESQIGEIAECKMRDFPIGRVVTVDEVFSDVARDEPFYDQSGGGVTFSGGEPMAQIDFLAALLAACKKAGLHCAVDTCGYAPWADFERIFDMVDLFLFDLKLIDPEKHITYTGVSNEIILSNLSALIRHGCNVEVRLPLIPNITDIGENLEAVASFLASLHATCRITMLPYNKLGEDKIERFNLPRRRLRLESQATSVLEQKAAYFRERGFEVRIGG